MRPPFRRFLAASALAALLVPTPALADPMFWALRQTEEGAGSAPPPAPPPVEEDTTISAVAGTPTEVTLPQLLQLAVRQSPSLELAKIDIEIAEAEIEQSTAIDDWSVGADANASYSTGVNNAGPSQTTRVGLSGDISRMLPSGGTVALHGETGWTRISTDTKIGDMPVTLLQSQYTDTLSAVWSQPLLRGRGREIVRSRIAQAEIGRDAASLARAQAALTAVRDVVNGYWDLVLSLRQLEIRRSSLDLARERLRITNAGIKGGGVAKTEALAVEQIIAQREEDVLTAELGVVQSSLDLRRLVGMEIGPGQLGLSTSTELGLPAVEWNLDAMIAQAYASSPELAQLEASGKQAEIEVEVSENGLLPQLDLSLAIGPVGQDENGPGKALVNMVTFDDIAISGGLSYSQSLGKHAASGAARAARASRLKIKINEADARAQIAQALAQAALLARSAERRVELAATAIQLAGENIKAEQSRFQLGKSTNFDVLQRQDELKQAELRQAAAIIDWHKAQTTAAAITGTLLGDYGVSLPD
ncbi:MAG: TolC family protein [Myxococcales bacterium]|nr:TolC family protein [Myxococcales bacterium]